MSGITLKTPGIDPRSWKQNFITRAKVHADLRQTVKRRANIYSQTLPNKPGADPLGQKLNNINQSANPKPYIYSQESLIYLFSSPTPFFLFSYQSQTYRIEIS
jgi:hypothetical protein